MSRTETREERNVLRRGAVPAAVTRAAALLLVALGGAAPATAEDLWVATTGDDANDCASEAMACRTLQRAVDDTAPSGDVIHVAEGTYVETVTIEKDVVIAGAGLDLTTFVGAADDRVFEIRSSTVCMSGLTVTGGFPPFGGGAGIRSIGSLRFEDVRLAENEAWEGPGGGLSSYGSAILERCIVEQNVGCGGGGIAADELVLVHTVVRDNRATACGCPPWVACLSSTAGISTVDATIVASTISDNSARSIGGIGISGEVALLNSTVSGNGGGGISCGASCNLHVFNSTITENSGDWVGGIQIARTAHVEMGNSVLANNYGRNCDGEIESRGHVILGYADGCDLVGDPTGNLVGVDPGLLPLADNGGRADELSAAATGPSEGSPCVRRAAGEPGGGRPALTERPPIPSGRAPASGIHPIRQPTMAPEGCAARGGWHCSACPLNQLDTFRRSP